MEKKNKYKWSNAKGIEWIYICCDLYAQIKII